MKRRDFLTTAGLGTLAAGLFPSSSLTAKPGGPKLLAKEDDNTDKKPLTEIYTSADRVRSGVAMGGIGAGSIELRKDGQFYNWSIFNNFPLSTGPIFELKSWPRNSGEDSLLFFLVRYQIEGENPKIKLLQINDSLGEGGLESIDYYFPEMSAVQRIEYSGRFPFVNMKFSDDDMPFDIELEAFSPFIPHDVKNSSLPGVFFNFKVKATGNKAVDVMLISSMRNLVGYDLTEKYFKSDLVEKSGYKYFNHSAGGMDTAHSSFGHMGMASLSNDTTYYLGWEHKHPYYERLLVEKEFPNIDDTKGRNIKTDEGELQGRMGFRVKDQRHFSSMGQYKNLKPGQSFDHSFVMSWYFPNNYGAHNDNDKRKSHDFDGDYSKALKITKNHGHYYNNFFTSAAEVADYMVKNKADLTKRSHEFVDNFYKSDAPQYVLDQINSNLNTYITSSTFTKEGKFGIREGMTPDKYWGPNATIDVSLYGSISILCLFPELQKAMMKAHRDRQTEEGEINHGLGFDLDYTQNGTWGVYHRIDMPGNYIQLVLRDYFYTNDKDYLKAMWPSIKKAVDYVLNHRDEDKDMMPDMEGIMCSYDNFPMWGLASYIQSQWLASMVSAMYVAEELGDKAAYKKYKKIFEKGSELMDKYLWNGQYYRLSNDYHGEKGVDEGCLTDQIIGQWLAHLSGLGYLFKEEHVKNALKKVLEMSFKKGFGLRNCSWPEHPDRYPIHKTDLWVDQANTPWTGVELAFASFLLYEDYYQEALAVIKEVDDRYRKANLYWDHQEFGGHYYRPMSSWGIINALLGLGVNRDVYHFAPKVPETAFTLFAAFAEGTAHYKTKGSKVNIEVLTGQWHVRELRFTKTGLNKSATVKLDGNELKAKVKADDNTIIVDFGKEITIEAGQSLIIG